MRGAANSLIKNLSIVSKSTITSVKSKYTLDLKLSLYAKRKTVSFHRLQPTREHLLCLVEQMKMTIHYLFQTVLNSFSCSHYWISVNMWELNRNRYVISKKKRCSYWKKWLKGNSYRREKKVVESRRQIWEKCLCGMSR